MSLESNIRSYFTKVSSTKIKISPPLAPDPPKVVILSLDPPNISVNIGEGNGGAIYDKLSLSEDRKVYYNGIHNPSFPLRLFTSQDAGERISFYVPYLDVWEKSVSSIDDPALEDPALGVETSTRTKIISQVKLHRIEDHEMILRPIFSWSDLVTLESPFFPVRDLITYLNRKHHLLFSTFPTETNVHEFVNITSDDQTQTTVIKSDNRTLPHQTFSIKLDGPTTLDKSTYLATLKINEIIVEYLVVQPDPDLDNIWTAYYIDYDLVNEYWNSFVSKKSSLFNINNKIRIIQKKEDATGSICESINTTTRGKKYDNLFYRIETHLGGSSRLSKVKLSRSNSHMVAKISQIQKINDIETRLSISQTNFGNISLSSLTSLRSLLSSSNWIEIIDDRRELLGYPGTMARVKDVDKESSIIFENSEVYGDPIDDTNYPQEFNPKIRLWDSRVLPISNEIPANELNGHYVLDFQDEGFSVQFAKESKLDNGLYWQFATRNGALMPEQTDFVNTSGSNSELVLSPRGIIHKLAPLALLAYFRPAERFTLLKDLRRMFVRATHQGINTGIIVLHVSRDKAIYGPFKHFLATAGRSPPSVVLALEEILLDAVTPIDQKEANFDEHDKLYSMEDYGPLVNLGGNPLQEQPAEILTLFKAVGITDEHFMIRVGNRQLQNQNFLVKLRFSAIAGEEQITQTNLETPELEFIGADFITHE